MTIKYYFEDFTVGRVFDSGTRQLSEADILSFAREYDPQYFHTDPEAAKKSIYGGLIASGWQTVGVCMRLMCDSYLLEAASMGSPGVDEVRWLKPVFPGDTLRMSATVIAAKLSASKPDRGTATVRWDVYNQKNERVMHMQGMQIMQRRPATN
ncbi:MAG: MaoC family dehydratase [Proteobacteria bacterium]|nr:MaoC family dehydratase [Pseudomonadota bacterium]